jgi:hypothetical protein
MNVPADLLYRLDPAWQCPRVSKPGGGKGRSGPTSAQPAAPDPASPVTTTIADTKAATAQPLPAWQRVLEANGITVLVVIGAVVWVVTSLGDIKTSIAKLEVRVDGLEQDVGAVKKRLNVLSGGTDETGEGFKPDPPEAPSAAPALPSAAPMPSPDPNNSVPKGPRAFPSNVKPTSPPDCVSAKTFNRMPCERAKAETCQGLPGFAPARYREIRLQAGVGEYMLVCDEK